jgi:hypothetical protein
MRTLIFGSVLIAIAATGFYSLISASLAAARDARPATFSERFAPALKSGTSLDRLVGTGEKR